ncbi:hypothetical protein EDD85DRAFT_951340 [Armillaria nabsnona]|nr:hypothetical protein EDD85DRAFT_951340 [Armillaria nabsnona]
MTTDRVSIPSTFRALDINTCPYFSSLPNAGIFVRPEYRKCLIYINVWLKSGGIEQVLEDVEKEVEYAMYGQELLTTGDQLVVGGHPLDAPTDVMNSYGEEFANGIADRAFIVLGDPGIGKTMFLYYLLIMRLIDGQPTALQVDRTDHFQVFDATGVYTVSHDFPLEEYIPKGTWALVDGNISIPGTTNIFSQPRSPFFIVHACSPRPSLIEYAKEKAKWTQYFMLPFSWREILLCRSLIRPPGVPTEIDISHWYDTFGPSARDCYN